jgi:hypothetical protein
MSSLQTYAIGAFIQSGAHYIRSPDDPWWVAWMVCAVILTAMHSWKCWRDNGGDE